MFGKFIDELWRERTKILQSVLQPWQGRMYNAYYTLINIFQTQTQTHF